MNTQRVFLGGVAEKTAGFFTRLILQLSLEHQPSSVFQEVKPMGKKKPSSKLETGKTIIEILAGIAALAKTVQEILKG